MVAESCFINQQDELFGLHHTKNDSGPFTLKLWHINVFIGQEALQAAILAVYGATGFQSMGDVIQQATAADEDAQREIAQNTA